MFPAPPLRRLLSSTPPPRSLPRLRGLTPAARVESLRAAGVPGLPVGDLDVGAADRMAENVISVFSVPLGVATGLVVNGREVAVPMATEEPSVIAAVCHMGKLTAGCGGFRAVGGGGRMRGQIQVVNPAPDATSRIEECRDELRMLGNGYLPRELARLGGRVVSVSSRELRYEEEGYPTEDMLSVDVVIDVVDSMGANTVNTVCESISRRVGEITGGKVGMRILSNLCVERLATSFVRVPAEDIGGEQVARGIAGAYRFARADPFRAATHNKGIMNGVSAVVLATGNDTRAVEAACHAFAGTKGHPEVLPERRRRVGDFRPLFDSPDPETDRGIPNTSYLPLTSWVIEEASGDLLGSIELPLAVGIVGGTIRAHPGAQANLRMMRVSSSNDLAGVIASVGLAQNMAALKALAGDGIQRGHMSLHARSVAAAAGVTEVAEVERVVAEMLARGSVSVETAAEIARERKQNQQ